MQQQAFWFRSISLFLLVVAIGTSACASLKTQFYLPHRVAPEVENTGFESDAKVVGTARLIDVQGTGYNFLRSWVTKKGGLVTHQLYVSHMHNGDWIFWNAANGEDASSMGFTSISSDVDCHGGCVFYEDFGVDVPDTLLRTHLQGYYIKVYSKTGNTMIMVVDSSQIRSQLRVTDSLAALFRGKR